MKKIFFTIIVIFSLTATFGQSKKEQIVQLIFSRDSLNTVLVNEQNSFNSKINELNTTIQQQKNEIVQLVKHLETTQKELTAKQAELDKLLTETDRINKLLKIKTQKLDELNAMPTSDFLITNNSVGYFKIGSDWQNLAKNSYDFKSIKGFGSCTDACCDGGFNLGKVLISDNNGQTIKNTEITIGASVFGKSESKTEHKSNPNVFFVSSDNCNGWYWKDKISYIITYSEAFKTKEGIGVGSTLEEVQEKLGNLKFYVGWIEEQENPLHFTIKSYPNLQFILDDVDYKGNLEIVNLTADNNSITISDFNKNTKIKQIKVDQIN
jgi:hypothetical protein